MSNVNIKTLPISQIKKDFSNKYYSSQVKDISLMKGGMESAAYFIETDKGKYVLKIFGLHQGNKIYIQNEVDMYDFLIKNNINVPKVHRSKTNKSVEQLKYRDKVFNYILMEYENISEMSIEGATESKTQAIGRTIGKMHKSLQHFNFISQEESGDTYDDGINVDWSNLETLPSILASNYNNQINLEDVKNFDSRVNFFLEKYDKEYEDLIKTVIHGDLYFEHTQFLPNNEVYIFDFGDREYAPAIKDISTFFIRINNGNTERAAKLTKWLLNGYTKEFKLPQKDINYIYIEALVSICEEINYICAVEGKRDSFGIDSIKEKYSIGNYILDNFESKLSRFHNTSEDNASINNLLKIDYILETAIKLRQNNNFQQALKILFDLKQRSPREAIIFYQIAWTYDNMDEEEKAAEYYEQAIRLGTLDTKDLEGAYQGLGSTYRNLGRLEESRNILKEGLLKFPESNTIKIFLALTNYSLKDYSQAIKELLEIIINTSSDENLNSLKKAIIYYSNNL